MRTGFFWLRKRQVADSCEYGDEHTCHTSRGICSPEVETITVHEGTLTFEAKSALRNIGFWYVSAVINANVRLMS